MVETMHFGGKGISKDDGDDLLTVKKTREQVYEEIMLKSKFY